MALIYDERTGEFINAPDTRRRPTGSGNRPTNTTSGRSGDSDHSGCLATVFESVLDGCLGCLETVFYGILGIIIYFGVPLIGIILLFKMCS